ERRRFLDLELCQLNRLYVHSLLQYNKVVAQRNRLLKELEFSPSLGETLSVWDQQLVRYGKELIRYRFEFLEELNPVIREIHFHLSTKKAARYFLYWPNVTAEEFEDFLNRSRLQEFGQMLTLTGPH